MTFTVVAMSPSEAKKKGFLFATCGGCGGAIMSLYDQSRRRLHGAQPQILPIMQHKGLLETQHVTFEKSWPEPPSTDAPEHTPEEIGRFYTQATKALAAGLWDAAGAMARKTLDVATRQLKPGDAFAKKNLAPRIDALADERLLVPALKDWAHAIRLDGNDAAHDPDPFTPEEAERIVAFTEMFLRFVYTLPGDLAERRRATESKPEKT